MFPFSKRVVEPVAAVLEFDEESVAQIALTPSKPQPIKAYQIAGVSDEYWKIANDLNLGLVTRGSDVLGMRVADFMWEHDIPMYLMDEVSAHMTAAAGKEKKQWYWRPLRQQDKDAWGAWGWGDVRKNDFFRGDEDCCALYQKAIPIEILRRVQTLVAEFPTLNFFVSDYGVWQPDPFIIAKNIGMNRICFGVWDEPGFTSSI